MPRVSRAETEKNRDAIEKASSRLFREQGLQASLKGVMGAAGLTHGGFYGHFKSKDDLVAAACASAFATSVERWQKSCADAADRPAARASLIESYLTPHKRSSMGTACPLSALAADVAREPEGKPVRKVFRDGLERLLGILSAVEPDGCAGGARGKALSELSALVGAMVLARAAMGSELSDEFMNAAKRTLLQENGIDPPKAARARHVRVR
jgi:TetR/AcrR family transcriptional regulator, transcriptional repressor for nem operon